MLNAPKAAPKSGVKGNGEWKAMKLGAAARERYADAARDTLRNDCRLNIRISRADLKAIQKRAFKEGPYQTLIAGVIHKYAAGRLRAV
ncbi:MAG: hypothetical protein ACRD04_10385 [Terriglobales bacterium]